MLNNVMDDQQNMAFRIKSRKYKHEGNRLHVSDRKPLTYIQIGERPSRPGSGPYHRIRRSIIRAVKELVKDTLRATLSAFVREVKRKYKLGSDLDRLQFQFVR
jgi:hypothetical protein